MRKEIEDRRNAVFVSVATAWEIAIKYSVGKLRLPVPPGEYVVTRCARAGFEVLPVQLAHATSVASLPMHHRDPFDRLLVAQAAHEGLRLRTLDERLVAYGLRFLPAEAIGTKPAAKARR